MYSVIYFASKNGITLDPMVEAAIPVSSFQFGLTSTVTGTTDKYNTFVYTKAMSTLVAVRNTFGVFFLQKIATASFPLFNAAFVEAWKYQVAGKKRSFSMNLFVPGLFSIFH